MSFTLEEVIEALDYEQPDDLVSAGDEVSEPRRQAWNEASQRLGIDAAFFQGAAPLIYFRRLAAPSREEVDQAVRDFHRRAWNHNRAPFLVVVLPDEIRVLDSLSAPFDDHEIGRAEAGVAVREALAEFKRSAVINGALAPKLRGLRRRGVIEVLRSDIGATRRSLCASGLPADLANNLLGRSLFLKYLEDRSGLPGTPPLAFSEALESSVADTYALFTKVQKRFNGDVFPVTPKERSAVTREHLQLVADLLRGARNGQLSLWPYYDFSVIPAELLSNVYEEFLADHRRDSASFYTPGYLVDLVLDEVFPTDRGNGPTAVLDPACGSGMFLARAYRRLINAESATKGRKLSPEELAQLLTDSIFGCELVPSAVRVAALSCYLVLLDHCSDEDIANVRFPVLLDQNLLEGDFFALQDRFLDRVFDLVVANPPWRSKLSEAANTYITEHALPIGDNQIAQAFFWASSRIVSDNGRVGLLMPSKSALYGRSGPNIAFRDTALRETNLDLVIDFSAFRHSVFHDAVGPMAVFVLGPRSLRRREHVTFCTPHRSPLSESAGRVILSGDEIKRLPRAEALRRVDYWKAALTGTTRDIILVEALRRRFPTLRDLETARHWQVGSGFQTGGGEAHASPLLQTSRFVPAQAIEPFRVMSSSTERVQAEHFHRVRGDGNIFRGPHILVRRGLSSNGRVRAAFLKGDAVFKNSVVGIAAPRREAEALEIVTAILNSDLARYYLFLTSSSWGVERPALEPTDLRFLPIALPSENSSLWGRLLDLSRAGTAASDAINEVVFEAYALSDTERALVNDLVRFGISQHHHNIQSEAFDVPDAHMLEAYRALLEQRLAEALDIDTSSSVEVSDLPYAAVSVSFGEPPRTGVLDELAHLVDQGPPDESGAVVLRRSVRIYRQRGVDISKPMERRFWSRASAIQDVDEIVADCLQSANHERAVPA